MKMCRDAFIDLMLGTKQFLRPGYSLEHKTLLVVRPSSYGDYFFVAPVLKLIRAKYARVYVAYVVNGKLDSRYIIQDGLVDQIIEVFRLPSPWSNEKFEMSPSAYERLRELLIWDPRVVVLSYEGTDGDYPFGDMSANLFKHYVEGAGLDYSVQALDRSYNEAPDFKLVSKRIFSQYGLLPYHYVIYHPFSSQEGRGWPVDKISQFLKNYDLPFPIVLLGASNEGGLDWSAWHDHLLDLRGRTTFLESMVLTKFAKFGIFAESCMMHVGQIFKVLSIITHVHEWTKSVTGPYHDQTISIVQNGSYSGLDVGKVFEQIKDSFEE